MITKAQQAELKKQARAANERIRGATESQQAAYQYYTSKYHTYKSKNDELLFRTGQAKTEKEYRQRMDELKKFLKSDYTTKSGWKKIQQEALSRSQDKLSEMGYDVTEEEIANIARETGGHNAAFYRALENITAQKLMDEWEDEDFFRYDEDDFEQELEQRRTDQEAAELLIRAREENKKRTEDILKKLKRAGRKKNV